MKRLAHLADVLYDVTVIAVIATIWIVIIAVVISRA